MIVAPSTERCANLTLNQSIEAHQHISLWTGRPEIEKAGNEMDKNAAEVQCGKERKRRQHGKSAFILKKKMRTEQQKITKRLSRSFLVIS